MDEFILAIIASGATPILIPVFLWHLENMSRKEGHDDQIVKIDCLKITHKTNGSVAGTTCETCLKSIIEETDNDVRLKLYYLELPFVKKCLNTLRVRTFWLWVCLAILFWLCEYMIRIIGPVIGVGADKIENAEKTFSTGVVVAIVIIGMYFYARRFLPIREFCDKIKKLN
jgi:hypothetical protein